MVEMITRKRKTPTKRTTPRKRTKVENKKVSFEITVPVRNVTPEQAAQIKADAKKRLTGAKFKKI